MSPYTWDSTIRVAKRDGNPARDYLLVNMFQAKHVPVRASKALTMFESLGSSVRSLGASPIVVAFAETATALGCVVANAINEQSLFIHSTRAIVDEAGVPLEFSEPHSHATDHRIYLESIRDRVVKGTDLVFVDDEYSTGRTLANAAGAFLPIFEKPTIPALHAVSLVNRMEMRYEHLEGFREVHYWSLLHQDGQESLDLSCDANVKQPAGYSSAGFSIDELISLPNQIPDPRTGVVAGEYLRSCECAMETVSSRVHEHLPKRSKVRVIGTEECMMPSLILGSMLEHSGYGYDVLCHSTTRSPICASSDPNYPVWDRYDIRSPYDPNRNTYVYNVGQCDLAIIVSDAKLDGSYAGMADIASVFRSWGCSRVWWIAV